MTDSIRQPVAPAHDRRHDDPQIRREDTQELHPARQDVHRLLWPLTGQGDFRGSSALSGTSDIERRRPPSINSSVAALRFFYGDARPASLARHLTFVHEPHKMPVILSPEEVVRLLEAAPGLKYKAALSIAYGAGFRASEVVALRCPTSIHAHGDQD